MRPKSLLFASSMVIGLPKMLLPASLQKTIPSIKSQVSTKEKLAENKWYDQISGLALNFQTYRTWDINDISCNEILRADKE